MKRCHVLLRVEDLDSSIGVYSTQFAAEPARVQGDCAKRMPEDPRIKVAVSTRGSRPGIDLLGLQTDGKAQRAAMKAHAKAADTALPDVGESTRCCARSEKHWVADPQRIAWTHVYTPGSVPAFSEAAAPEGATTAC